MNTWLLSFVGASLIFLGIWETFMAVLHPRAVTGPVTSAINRGSHRLLKTSLGRSQRVALFSGPLLIVTQVLAWATLLLIGASFIVWPQLGNGITASGNEVTDHSFASAIYYAGFTITTLGVGDLVPRTPSMRVFTVTVAGIGFSFFTLVLAYVISIYSTLARRNQFANEIDYRTQRTGDAVNYIGPYLVSSDPSLINQDLYLLSTNLAELLESHHFYPSLHYFRFAEPRYAMSRMLRVCLEVATQIRCIREIEGPTASTVSEPADRLWHAALQMLEDTKQHFIVCHAASVIEHDETAMKLVRFLEDHQGERSFDNDEFVQAYVRMCQTWSADLSALKNGSSAGRVRGTQGEVFLGMAPVSNDY
jgi:hypothetical protein